jgi:hypothetical protein
VDRRASSSNVIIVHAREVVVHERICVHDFDRSGQAPAILCTADSLVRRGDEHTAQPFSAAEQAVSNRVGDSRLNAT